MQDKDCICEGNWRKIIKESESLFNRYFTDEEGEVYYFVGVIYASDDYYYCMVSKAGELKMLSCVDSIEDHGYKNNQSLEADGLKYGHRSA